MTRPAPLVRVGELAAALDAGERMRVLDVRWRLGGPPGAAEFALGHVPGARYVDLERDLADPPGKAGRHPLPAPDRFEEAMRAAGVDDGSPVVVYDDWSGLAAARAWWLLRHHGHDDVRVLDGGWSAWRSAGRVETGAVSPVPRGDFTSRPACMPVIGVDEVPAFAGRGVLVDARAAERYRGEVEPVDPVAGHIPGAVNVPATGNVDADGRFRPADELRATYAAVGAVTGAEVAAYCGSGVTAAHDVLALEIAGVEAALYAGSWSEWVADPSRPVVTSGRP